jgi:hypothetical protein
MRGHVARVIALALLVGCAATGAKVTEDQLLQFQKGSTTLDQVVAKLGRPTTTMLMPNGADTTGVLKSDSVSAFGSGLGAASGAGREQTPRTVP